jgi:AP-1-like factor
VQQYEQGEIERSITLQNLGKRLKEENDLLRQENTQLKAENEHLKARLAIISSDLDHASPRMERLSVANTLNGLRGEKRDRNEQSPPSTHRLKRLKTSNTNEPPPLCLTPSQYSPSSHNLPSPVMMDLDEDDMRRLTIKTPFASHDNTVEAEQFSSCGLCTSSIDCLCRQLGINGASSINIDAIGEDPSSTLDSTSGLEDAISFSLHSSLKEVTYKERVPREHSGCSGDPKNCEACANNVFGQAFCSALGTAHRCSCRSRKATTANTLQGEASDSSPVRCCKNPEHCRGRARRSGSAFHKPRSGSVDSHPNRSTNIQSKNISTTMPIGEDTVPCDVVWKTLEAHPNSHLVNPSFGPSHLANLHLLAEVVARKACCTLEPGESMPDPEEVLLRRQQRSSKTVTMEVAQSSAHLQIGYEDDEVLQGHYPRAMVPEELLQGRQRVLTVRSEGMRDAIALLDRQFGCS